MTDQTRQDVSAVLAKTPGIQYLVLESQATVYEYAGGWADLRSRMPMPAATTMMGWLSAREYGRPPCQTTWRAQRLGAVVFERSKRAAACVGTMSRTPMTTAVKAVYENGVFKPKEPVHLQLGSDVEMLIPTQSRVDHDPTGREVAQAIIGIDHAPADMAESHDQCLHGSRRG